MEKVTAAIVQLDPPPDPVAVDFRRRDSAFEDVVVSEGHYVNEGGERFRITLAALREDEAALDDYAAELGVWAKVEQDSADAELDVQGTKQTDRRLRMRLDQLAQDGATVARVAFDIRLVEAPAVVKHTPTSFMFLVDPRVRDGEGRSYDGPDDVYLQVIQNQNFPNSRVDLRGLTYSPRNQVVGGPARRDANNHCRVVGLAGASRFTIQGRQGAGRWTED